MGQSIKYRPSSQGGNFVLALESEDMKEISTAIKSVPKIVKPRGVKVGSTYI